MTHEEAVLHARTLTSAIRERAAEAERMRRQPDETIREFVDTGITRLLIPASWGGYELSFDTFVDSILEIAKADGSAGWCYSLFIIHPWFLALFPYEAQHDVWSSNLDALLATSFIPAGRTTHVEGGYRLTGNWPWSSGIDCCSWAMIMGLVIPDADGGKPEQRLFLVPQSDYEIVDTWFVAGQKGTGSKNVVVKDVFVPEYHTVLFSDLVAGKAPGTHIHSGPLYRYPLTAIFPASLATPILGTTIGAYETWCKEMHSKIMTYTRQKVAEFPHVQIRVAEIAAEIDSAHLLLRRILDTVCTGDPLSTKILARNQRDYAYIARLCVRAIEQIFLASGGGANYESHPLQRYWRDVHAMVGHTVLNFDRAGEIFGRAELGLPDKPH